MKKPSFFPTALMIGFGVFVAVVLIGTIGFLVEGLSPVDAVFTTVSAVTTVGYSPSHPLSASGKIFVTVLVLVGVGTGIYVFGAVTEYLIEGGLRGSLHRRDQWRRMAELRDHFIVAGFGRVGQSVAEQLEHVNVPFIILDNNPAVLPVARDRGYLYLEADATSDRELALAGIDRARGLVACSDSDVRNVYMTLSARALNENIFIIARGSDAQAERNLHNAGADRVISPYTMAGRRMAHLAVQPLAADFIDIVLYGKQIGVQIEEVEIGQDSPLLNRSVGEIRAHELSGGQVLAVERAGDLITFVDEETVLSPNDRILIAGTNEQVAAFNAAIR